MRQLLNELQQQEQELGVMVVTYFFSIILRLQWTLTGLRLLTEQKYNQNILQILTAKANLHQWFGPWRSTLYLKPVAYGIEKLQLLTTQEGKQTSDQQRPLSQAERVLDVCCQEGNAVIL